MQLVRPRHRPAVRATTLLLVLASVAGGCGLEPGARFGRHGATPGVLRIQVARAPRDVTRLDPPRAHTPAERDLATELFRGLTELDHAGAPAPGLATAWSLEEGRLRLQLDRNARFSDGSTLVASDVVWSWRRALRPSTGAADLRAFSILRHGTALAQRTLLRVGTDGAQGGAAPFPSFRSGVRPARGTRFAPGEAVVVVDTNLRTPCCGAAVPLLREPPAPQVPPRSDRELFPGDVGVVIAARQLGEQTYLQLRAPSGAVGWAESDLLEVHVPEPGLTSVVDHGGGVRLRAGPEEDAPVRVVLEDEEVVEVLERGAQFVAAVAVDSGATGWISRGEIDGTARNRAWLCVVGIVDASRADASDAAPTDSGSVAERSDAAWGDCWLPDDALAFDPALLDATPVDDHTVDIGLAAGVTLDDALRALAAPAMRPVPPRLVETHGRTWTTPGRLVTSGGLRLVELHGDKAQDLAVVLAPWRPGTSGIERIELYDYARATTALHLYRSGFLHAILDGGLPEDVRPALAVSRDFVPGARGGALLAPEVQGLRGDGLRLRDVRLAREATP